MKLVEKILRTLQTHAELTAHLLDVTFSGYGSSYRKMRRFLRQGPPRFSEDWAELYRKRQAFYATLNRLKRDGLVVKKQVGRSSLWRISGRGMGRLRKLTGLMRKRQGQELPQRSYSPKNSKDLVVVAFDIPERERHKRRWLRFHLRRLGFVKLQQSLWVGRVQIPQEFLKDLREYGVLDYVDIFLVTKAGTITKAI